MKTIMITMSRGSLIRNFFYTGVITKLLDYGHKVIILTPNYNEPEKFFGPFLHKNLIFEDLKKPKLKMYKILEELFKGAVFNQTVHVRYRYRFAGRPPNLLLYIPRMLFFAPLRWVPGFKKFIRAVDTIINSEKDNDELIKKYNPDLIFATSTGEDISLIKGAKRLGIPSILMPKSWDSVSKKLFGGKSTYIFVWNQFMKDQMLKFQDYKQDQIFMSGVPQFDFYHDPKRIWTKEKFCQRFSLDPNKKIIFYGSTGGGCCNEGDYVTVLHEIISQGKIPNTQILVRPHMGYKGDKERFAICEKYDTCTVDNTAVQDRALADNWALSDDQIEILTNSLYHADIVINIASTLTLDATAAGTPVINIHFDAKEGVDPNYSTKRLYKSDYIEAVTSKGATWIVKSKQELIQALDDVLLKNKRKTKQVQDLIDYMMYKNDGQAAERLAKNIHTLITK